MSRTCCTPFSLHTKWRGDRVTDSTHSGHRYGPFGPRFMASQAMGGSKRRLRRDDDVGAHPAVVTIGPPPHFLCLVPRGLYRMVGGSLQFLRALPSAG